jgi:hypothetical protein
LNAYAKRWVRSVKDECLSKVILLGERSLRRALNEFVEHYHAERNHQGKGNVLLFPRDTDVRREGPVQCRERLGGLLRLYEAPRVKGGNSGADARPAKYRFFRRSNFWPYLLVTADVLEYVFVSHGFHTNSSGLRSGA